jgi:hypothetical protein
MLNICGQLCIEMCMINYYKSCDVCQRTRGLATQSFVKLVTSLLEEPWGLDFVGPVKLT